ncbi:MAG: BTAD domain-containing putative transcriptional regulator [Caldilineaceae bacterium]
MVELQIACLGELQVTRADAVLTLFHTDKNRALLAYLALESRVHTRAELAQLLWPGYSDESARSSLRQALHQLRQTLSDAEAERPWLLLTRQTVQLNPDAPIHVDVLTFRHLLATCASHAHADLTTCAPCLARLRQAVDLYRGDFLAGFSVADSPPFEEWRRVIQEQLHIQVLDALTHLVTAAEAAGDTDGQALHDARRLLTLEPWLEAAHCQVMRLLARRGERAEALAQYQRCRQVLAEELGVEPDAETTALYEQIRAGKFSRETGRQEDKKTGRQEDKKIENGTQERLATGLLVSPASPLPVSLPAVRDWAEMPAVDFFVERSAEVTQLTAWLLPASAPDPGRAPVQLITILGMGGMGKTTLAALVTRSVASSFAVVIWRSLLNAPPLGELLRAWLQTLSRQSLTVLPDALDDQLRLLLTYLQRERCLLVLDNVESIFATDPSAPTGSAQPQSSVGPFDELRGLSLSKATSKATSSRAGVTRPGYEGYDQLFQRLATSEHQSCLLLTSREQPYALARIVPGRGPQSQADSGRTRLLLLGGLDQQAGHLLLESVGLQATGAEAAQLTANYSGNPLALQIVAGAIVDFFEGDVAAFQQEAGGLFDGLRLVLDQQFARLSPLEREILVWLAIEREAISVPTLRNNFVQSRPEGTRTGPLIEALQALQSRSLLEKRDTGFTLQNVIIEYTTEYLVEQVYQEIMEEGETRRQEDRKTRLVLEGRQEVAEQHTSAVSLSPPHPVFLSFLNRFALLKAQAREEVRQSQVRLILQPLADRLLAQLGQAQLETRVMALVQGLQAFAPLTPGYAGGNLLNLLLHIGSDLRGRNFAKLALWQVFLAGTYVPGLNLAGADLTGTVFTQRFGTLRNIQFDDQGDLLLVDIHNRRLRLLRLRDGQLYHEIALPDWHFRLPILSPDCRSVLLPLVDDRLALLDLTTGKLSPPQARHQHPIWRFCFSPDGRFVATGDSSGLICIWDRQGLQLVQERQISDDAVSALAIAPDGETMASANVAGTIFLWSLANQSALRRLQGHEDEVATLVFLDNGRLLASGSHDLTVGLWEVATGELRQRLRGHTRPVRKSGAATTGQWLVTGGGDHFLYVWDWQRGAPHHLLADHASPIDHLVISPDGKQAAAQDLNTVVSHWDLTHGRRLDYYAIYYNSIMSICFSPDGQTLVSGGSYGAVYLWAMDNSVGLRLLDRLAAHNYRIAAVAFHPDGNLIAGAGENAGIVLWERSSGRLVQTLQGDAKPIAMLDFSPNGNWLASGNGDGTVTLWSMPDGRQQRQLRVHTNMVSCCAFSPSRVDSLGQPQQRVASGSFDHTLALWDAESGALLHHLRGHTNAIGRCLFSHDGERLISVSHDATLCIWDVESGERLATWPHLGAGYVALAVHPAGQLLAVSCLDHAIRLLELSSGCCLAELHGHSLPALSLAFHPSKPLLASAGADETIRLWDISSTAMETGQIGCLHTLQAPTPYAGMKISGVTGISEAQKASLRALGAVEE